MIFFLSSVFESFTVCGHVWLNKSITEMCYINISTCIGMRSLTLFKMLNLDGIHSWRMLDSSKMLLHCKTFTSLSFKLYNSCCHLVFLVTYEQYYRCRHLRQKDREANADNYPHLYYPEVYLLQGGYKHFYEMFPVSWPSVSQYF